MMVTARATDAEPKESLAGRDDHFIEGIVAGEAFGGVVFSDLSGQQDGGGDQETGGRVFADRVAGELFVDESVVGLVVVEGADDSRGRARRFRGAC